MSKISHFGKLLSLTEVDIDYNTPRKISISSNLQQIVFNSM